MHVFVSAFCFNIFILFHYMITSSLSPASLRWHHIPVWLWRTVLWAQQKVEYTDILWLSVPWFDISLFCLPESLTAWHLQVKLAVIGTSVLVFGFWMVDHEASWLRVCIVDILLCLDVPVDKFYNHVWIMEPMWTARLPHTQSTFISILTGSNIISWSCTCL